MYVDKETWQIKTPLICYTHKDHQVQNVQQQIACTHLAETELQSARYYTKH